jgi:hypothetical protein
MPKYELKSTSSPTLSTGSSQNSPGSQNSASSSRSSSPSSGSRSPAASPCSTTSSGSSFLTKFIQVLGATHLPTESKLATQNLTKALNEAKVSEHEKKLLVENFMRGMTEQGAKKFNDSIKEWKKDNNIDISATITQMAKELVKSGKSYLEAHIIKARQEKVAQEVEKLHAAWRAYQS